MNTQHSVVVQLRRWGKIKGWDGGERYHHDLTRAPQSVRVPQPLRQARGRAGTSCETVRNMSARNCSRLFLEPRHSRVSLAPDDGPASSAAEDALASKAAGVGFGSDAAIGAFAGAMAATAKAGAGTGTGAGAGSGAGAGAGGGACGGVGASFGAGAGTFSGSATTSGTGSGTGSATGSAATWSGSATTSGSGSGTGAVSAAIAAGAVSGMSPSAIPGGAGRRAQDAGNRRGVQEPRRAVFAFRRRARRAVASPARPPSPAHHGHWRRRGHCHHHGH